MRNGDDDDVDYIAILLLMVIRGLSVDFRECFLWKSFRCELLKMKGFFFSI